jgi:sugar/nucleoside kinase (ribokinase family)
VRKHGAQTSCTMLPIHPDGSRPAWHVPGANSTFCLDDVAWDALEQCDAVHLGGLTALPGVDGADAGAILQRAREHGALTTADCLGVRGERAQELVAAVMPHVDIFMPNDGEALLAADAADVLTAARRFRDQGARCVIVKCGPDGCLIVDDDGERTLPAHQIEVVDTTGCGTSTRRRGSAARRARSTCAGSAPTPARRTSPRHSGSWSRRRCATRSSTCRSPADAEGREP